GGLEGRLGLQVCVSLVQFIQGNERRCFNIDNGAWSIEREKANSSMREPEIVWRAGVRIDSYRESSQRLSQRNHRAPVLDETSARDGPHEHALRIQKVDLLSSVRGGTRRVDVARRFLSERFMRPAVVEVGSPQVARSLLVLGTGRGDCLDLHGHVAMHALVPAVVGWRALARAQMVDAEAQPPGREPGQAEPAIVRNER